MAFTLLDTDQTIAEITRLVRDAKKAVLLVSPYFHLREDARFVATVRGALERKVLVNLFVREDHNDSGGWDVVSDLMLEGLVVKAVPRLHAKLYWSDAGAVITSLNLLTSSMEKSIEVGMRADDQASRAEVGRYIDTHVRPRLDVEIVPSPAPRGRSRDPRHSHRTEPTGCCIRCGSQIPLDPARPYCWDCFGVWRAFENPEYVEALCHSCGRPFAATMARPRCWSCYHTA